MGEVKRHKGTQFLLLNAPSKELVRTHTPYGMIAEGHGEHYMPGFDALFVRQMMLKMNKDSEGRVQELFTNSDMRIPKAQVLKLLRGCGEPEAVYALKIALRVGIENPLAYIIADILVLMAEYRWREAAMLVHQAYFWCLSGPIPAMTFEDMTDEQREHHNYVCTTAVIIAEDIFDNPGEAFKLKVSNPHYLQKA